MILLIFVILYVLWTIGPEWDLMKLIPSWLKEDKNKGKINKNY